MRPLELVMLRPQDLKERKQNAQIHPEKQIKQIMRSMEVNGVYSPLIVDEAYTVIAGHARLEAAGRLGYSEVPCVILRGLSEAQKLALMLADNKIAANATTDRTKLAVALSEILEIDIDFDLTLTGYTAIEIDQVELDLAPRDKSSDPQDDDIPAIDEGQPAFTAAGDIWICGNHRIICGNALHHHIYERLLGSETAQMCMADPPFNLSTERIGSSGSIKHREFEMASGEMLSPEFEAFLEAVFLLMVEFSQSGSIHFVFMDWRHLAEITAAGQRAFTELKNLIVWAKDNGGMGTFYRSRHELIFAFKNGTAPHINNFELGQHGRYRTNVWEYRGLNTGGRDRQETLKLHPTVKPVKMLADALQDCSQRGGIVLDPFGGSGSTMIAAERTGRRARLIEIDPLYVDTTIRRWQAMTKDDAIHAKTGETFNQREQRLKRAREIASICWIPDPTRQNVRRVDFSKAVQ